MSNIASAFSVAKKRFARAQTWRDEMVKKHPPEYATKWIANLRDGREALEGVETTRSQVIFRENLP